MAPILVVGAVIIKNNQILCAKRGPSKSIPYKWEFPGGKIEQGETPQEALKREIQEELTCTIEVGEEVTRTIHTYDFGEVDLTTFYCKVVMGTPVPTEHPHLEWRSPHDLLDLDWAPADIPAARRIRENFAL